MIALLPSLGMILPMTFSIIKTMQICARVYLAASETSSRESPGQEGTGERWEHLFWNRVFLLRSKRCVCKLIEFKQCMFLARPQNTGGGRPSSGGGRPSSGGECLIMICNMCRFCILARIK